MTREYKVSFFAFLFSLLFFLPHTAHGRLAVHHIHRSLPRHNQHAHRQINNPAPLSGLGNILPSIEHLPDHGGTSSPPPSSTVPDGSPATTAPTATTTPSPFSVLSASSPSSSPPPQTSDPSSPSSSPPPQTSDPSSPSSSPPPQTSDPSSPSSSPPPQKSDPSSPSSQPSTSNPPSSPPTSDSTPAPSPAISSPQSSQPPSSPSTPSPTVTCPLGVDLLGQCIVPPASSQPQTPTLLTSSSDTPAPPLSSNAPTSSAPPSSNAPTSPAPPSSNAPTSPAPPSSNTPASSPPPSSDTPTSPLSSNIPISSPLPAPSNAPISFSLSSSTPIFLTPLSSNTPNSLPPPSASSPPASPTNLPSPSANPQTTQTALASSPPPDNQLSSPSPNPTSAIPSSGSVLRQSLTSFPTSQLPSSSPGFDSRSQSPPVPTLGSSNSGVSSSSGLSLPLPSTPISSQSGTPSIPGSLSRSASDTAVEPSMTFSGTNSASLDASSSPPVISFPSYTTGLNDQTTSVRSTSTGSSAPVFTQNSQFSYVTATSLLGTSFQSSSIPLTLTNPDAATTTLSLTDPSTSAAGPVPSAPLPADLPARIYPADLVNPAALPSGDVLCSLLFTSFLPWNFVATHTQSQGQLFSWTPLIISQALNISSTETPAFALQVFVPDSYRGTDDAEMLRTEYLFYLQSNLVPILSNQIRARSSSFYDIAEPYKDLAIQVDPAFAITSVPNPSAVPGTTSTASSSGNKSRTATIIGVVSALGGLALIILGVLIFNGVKRSRQLRHQRLSDPNLPNDPYPDRTGRDFDQDSVGGPRRRSFYFAEDSLRGQPQTAEQSTVPVTQARTQYVVQPGSQIQYSSRSSPENVRERRAPVMPGTISAPILTQSSLNW